jgi:hypothetical protein
MSSRQAYKNLIASSHALPFALIDPLCCHPNQLFDVRYPFQHLSTITSKEDEEQKQRST